MIAGQLALLHAEPVAFAPAGPRSTKVACVTCGRAGYAPGKWQNACRRGHAPCPHCGKQLTLKLDGAPRAHTCCPLANRASGAHPCPHGEDVHRDHCGHQDRAEEGRPEEEGAA